MDVINIYIILILSSLGINIIHLGFITNRYTYKLYPFLLNQKIIWDPNIDRLKFVLTSVIFITPLFFLITFIKFNSNIINLNITGLILIILFGLFCFWFDIKKVNYLKNNLDRNPANKNISPKNEISKEKHFTKKPGRQYSIYIEVALKYLLLQKFIPEEKITNKYQDNNELFFNDIAKKMIITDPSFARNSFRSTYYKINDNLEIELKHRQEHVLNLLNDKSLMKHKEIEAYLKKINNK